MAPAFSSTTSRDSAHPSKRARVGEIACNVHESTVKEATARVIDAMKKDLSGWTAVQLDWLIRNNKLKGKKATDDGAEKPLPASCKEWCGPMAQILVGRSGLTIVKQFTGTSRRLGNNHTCFTMFARLDSSFATRLDQHVAVSIDKSMYFCCAAGVWSGCIPAPTIRVIAALRSDAIIFKKVR